MRFLASLILLFYLGFSLPIKAQNKNQFTKGEKITYAVRFGLLEVGELQASTDSVSLKKDSTVYFKAQIIARTVGALGLFANIYNEYYSEMDSVHLHPLKFVRKQKENDYSLYETVEFDHSQKSIVVSRRKDDLSFEIKNFSLYVGVNDLVSLFYATRSISFDTLRKTKQFLMPVFYEDSSYNVAFAFQKKEKIKTSIGRIKSYVICPVIPTTKNTIFVEKDPILIWFSDDEHRIPLKIEAKTRWGTIHLDLKSYNRYKKKRLNFLFF